MENDVYKTIAAPAEAVFKDRSSKFYAYSYPVKSAEDVKPVIDELHKKYYDATHHCYAYRLGPEGKIFRVNDDGEPSGTAGKPILGQMLSTGLTDCLIVVVRYFGGTKLGVPGLINACRESAAAVISESQIIELTVDTIFEVVFPYVCMNDVMRVIKEEQPRIISQDFDNVCSVVLAIRQSKAGILLGKLEKIEGSRTEEITDSNA